VAVADLADDFQSAGRGGVQQGAKLLRRENLQVGLGGRQSPYEPSFARGFLPQAVEKHPGGPQPPLAFQAQQV
jgi:hypothetical protein